MPAQLNHEAKKTFRTFALATFLNDLGSDMIYPIWPLFVTTVLRANMAALGLVDGIGEALVSLSKAASGYLSDRIHKRKIFIWIGYLMAAVSRLGYSLSTRWPQLIPFKILDRLGKERSAPRDAYIADISDYKNLGRHFGLLRAMDHLGGLCGILVCILLIRFCGYRTIFIFSALPTFISALLIITRIQESKPPSFNTGPEHKHLDLNPRFILFLVIGALHALGAFSYSFLLLYAKEIGFTTTFIPLLYLIITASASLSSLFSGKLAFRMGSKPILLISYLAWIWVCIIIILSQSHVVLLISFIFYGSYKGILIPIQRTIASELAPVAYRASFLGLFQMVTGLCALPASLVAGLLWEKFNPLVPFYCSLLLTIISGVLVFFLKSTKPEEFKVPGT
jgi:MFS family permease